MNQESDDEYEEKGPVGPLKVSDFDKLDLAKWIKRYLPDVPKRTKYNGMRTRATSCCVYSESESKRHVLERYVKSDYHPGTWSLLMYRTRRRLKNLSICNTLSDAYLYGTHGVFTSKADVVWLASTTCTDGDNNEQNICGFGAAHAMKSEHVLILDIVCALPKSRAGERILNDLEQYAFLKGFPLVAMQSVLQAVSYYLNHRKYSLGHFVLKDWYVNQGNSLEKGIWIHFNPADFQKR